MVGAGQRVSAEIPDQVPAGAVGGAEEDGRGAAREARRRGDRGGGKDHRAPTPFVR